MDAVSVVTAFVTIVAGEQLLLPVAATARPSSQRSNIRLFIAPPCSLHGSLKCSGSLGLADSLHHPVLSYVRGLLMGVGPLGMRGSLVLDTFIWHVGSLRRIGPLGDCGLLLKLGSLLIAGLLS